MKRSLSSQAIPLLDREFDALTTDERFYVGAATYSDIY